MELERNQKECLLSIQTSTSAKTLSFNLLCFVGKHQREVIKMNCVSKFPPPPEKKNCLQTNTNVNSAYKDNLIY